ncbi:cell surface protein SprA [Flavobacterium columnare]|uniref:T9SS outer membrane translocon Sov/SprA n=1 Tax=Flavobacterium columnare TaxID=996 RepID=UPI001896529A|nr:cell surface protein SprA [Flavobacterium columnare]MBF6653397.1 cell surface protein SprA [Flavobacterium columnare]
MKNNFSFPFNLLFKNSFYILFFFVLNTAHSQEVKDTLKGYQKGKMDLPDPQSILEAYTYDPVMDQYIYTKSFEGFTIDYPIVLTPDEYQKLIKKEAIRKYFKEKGDAVAGQKKNSEEKKRDLLPRYYIRSGLFESIFGSNTIDIKPTGSVEIDLGMRYSKQDNPAFSPRNRSNFNFDFDQRISMSLMGQVGTRLRVNVNYDTESTFAFQNLIKLEYTPTEDDILQKIEVGNVSMPLSNSLIRGAQSLFGFKTELKFGRTTFTGVFSEQKSQTRTVTAQGGGLIQDFDMFALDYDADRHFFLSQFFRNNYDRALETYPVINSRTQITRLEVWITNRQNRINAGVEGNNLRNIVALSDLGEAGSTKLLENEIVGLNPIPANFFKVSADTPVDNANNAFNPKKIGDVGSLLNEAIRDVSNVSTGFNGLNTREGVDYSKLENARKLNPNEYTYHPQLGYISLNQRLTNDEVLAVAYQYTEGDKVYQVGEFGNDGVTSSTTDINDIPVTKALILKLLKPNLNNVDKPIWNLMMKNIYQIPGAYQLEKTDFKFNILYTDPSPINYITLEAPLPLRGDISNVPLLKVFDLDKLDFYNDPSRGDGFFDFLPGLTIDTQNARIIFTKVEPFGKSLFEKLTSNNGTEKYNDESSYNLNQKKYVYTSLYRKTQAAALQNSEKNKFQLKGKFKSTGGDGISLGAVNVPRGSVVVTAGGRVLQEGVDYTVNYQAGRVQILDPSLQASGTPIQVSVENNSMFGQQTRRYMGFNIEHKISDKFQINGTLINMSERPFTQKTNYGQESVNNTMFGLNGNFSTEVPFFTRLVNKLPNIDTDAPSNLSFRGEFAYLMPGTSKIDRLNGESTVYIDDFEGSQSSIDMRSPQSWSLASVPDEFQDKLSSSNLSYGFNRAKLSWYTIDPIFYTSQRPSGITDDDISTYDTRRVYIDELYPQTSIAIGDSRVVNTLDLTYYPKERGPYNFNPAALNNQMPDPTKSFAGIMRPITTTNFEQANVEYIQFWLLDPYYKNLNGVSTANTGKITIHLGEVSEDVLKDGKKMYENGLPGLGSDQKTLLSQWGKAPANQSLIYTFDSNNNNRSLQDVGLNGLSDDEERIKFPEFANQDDPAMDNYQYYLNTSGKIVDRYKKYNGTEKNSPVDVTDSNRGNSTIPDVEDINRDNTMNTVEGYYKFEIDIKPNVKAGDKYVVSERIDNDRDLGAGQKTSVRWIQYKIPISEGIPMGGISDTRSIRFMRMLVNGFSDQITLRFGALDLVRGEWRRYGGQLTSIVDPNTNFEVQSINIEENGQRSPIPYVLPPNVKREQINNNNTVVNQNEQSLLLRVGSANDETKGLADGQAKAVFKNVSVDMRQYNRLKMFLHSESLLKSDDLKDKELSAFIRFGNDFTNNFYEIEVPLKVTPFGQAIAENVWPVENEINLALSALGKLKLESFKADPQFIDADDKSYVRDATVYDNGATAGMKIRVKGNPNIGYVRTLMVGLKNPKGGETTSKVRGEVWFNELRLAEMNESGGMAAVASLDTNMADFLTLSATGRMGTIGFGSIEQKPNERSREDMWQYDLVTNVSLGKLLPKKWGVNLPFNYAIGEQTITPEYDPLYQDLKLKDVLAVAQTEEEKDAIRKRSENFTKRRSINFIGVKKERSPEQKPHVYDVENLTLSYSYNEMKHRDFEVQNVLDQQVRTTADYAYAFKTKTIEPFKQTSFMKKSAYWKLLSDLNFNLLPSNINFSSSILRQFNRQQFRQVDQSIVAGVEPLYRRNYLFNYNYGFNFNFTRSFKVNYTATTGNIVRTNLINQNDDSQKPEYTVWDDFWNVGEPNQHNQQITANYTLPIEKIPVLSFIKSDYTYTGNYSWNRGSDAMRNFYPDKLANPNLVYDLGNTIQNANTHKLNTSFSMTNFYKYIGLVKFSERSKKPVKPVTPVTVPKPGEKIVAKPKEKIVKQNVFLDGLIGVATAIKNIQVNYSETNGTLLPGYLPSIGFLGSSRPSLGFVFGMQDEVRFEAAKNGWLTNYDKFNQNFTKVNTKQLQANAKLEPFTDLTIDLVADRTISNNYSEQFTVTDGNYNSLSPYQTGNFSISTLMIGTAFATSDENGSSAFEAFRKGRKEIAQRLAQERASYDPLYDPTQVDSDGFPKGYSKNSQQVLLPAFLAAYTSDFRSSSNVPLSFNRFFPLPNWNIKYTGLIRYKFFKERFRSFSIQHAYKSAYTLNSYRSNFEYDKNPNGVDVSGNYYSSTLIGNVNLTEQFSPLLRLDIQMKNSLKFIGEIKKDRILSLSFDNNLLTELKGQEYIFGIGYRIKDVTVRSRLADNNTGVVKSDINLRGDISFRNNKTIVRNIDYNNNQLGGGQNIVTAKFSGDYKFSSNLTTLFYFDYNFNRAVISTSFPITNIRAGFTLRYTLGN